MCGIAGIASPSHIAGREWLGAANATMGHRGPDSSGEWWAPEGGVGFAHRRLAIIDLSEAGRQPMLSADSNLSITFNGEIYNYREVRNTLEHLGHAFRSESDTEVIIAAYRQWGAECLSWMKGMFAFALYDSAKRELFLARDRVGEKPLYYSLRNGELRFASEVKALFIDKDLPRTIDWASLDCYLAHGFVPGGRSMLRHVRKLAPAHALKFDVSTGREHTWRYWQPPAWANHGERNTDLDLLDELEACIQQAVARQLVADVPIGVLLSGGVDSSLVTAMAARAKPGVKTFTVRFPGYGSFDETEHARLIARHFGTDHIEIEAGQAEVDMLAMLARQFDEPMVDSSMVPTYLLTKQVRRHCTVALGGDGGDELFGGYPHYNRMLWLQAASHWLPRPIRSAAAAVAGRCLPVGFRGRNWAQALSADFHNSLPLVTQLFDRPTRMRLMASARKSSFVAEKILATYYGNQSELLQRAMRFDFETYLPEDLLVKVDRASMLNSLEVRAPFLDVSVVEFAFGRVPIRLKASRRHRKILLKRLAARILPKEFDQKRKQGFSIPLSAWLQGGKWREYFCDILFDRNQTLFDHSIIRHMLDKEGSGQTNAERLFGLVMFELWRREYQIDIST